MNKIFILFIRGVRESWEALPTATIMASIVQFFIFSYVIIWVSSKSRFLHVSNNFKENPDCPQSITNVVSVTKVCVPSLSIEKEFCRSVTQTQTPFIHKWAKFQCSRPVIGQLSSRLNPFTILFREATKKKVKKTSQQVCTISKNGEPLPLFHNNFSRFQNVKIDVFLQLLRVCEWGRCRGSKLEC